MSLLPSLLNFAMKRRMSVTLPNLVMSAASPSEKKTLTPKKMQRKTVTFPSAVLMQQAITEGDVVEMRQLISGRGSNVVTEREPSGLPPVMRAVFESQTECLKVLVEEGADITAQDEEHWTALHVAAAMDDIEAANYIISACKASLTQVNNVDGERPIDLAESTEMARLLLQADLRELRIESEAATKDAAVSESTVLRLVTEHHERGSDCEALNTVLRTNTCYDTLLHLAASKNYPRLANYLLQRKVVDTESKDRRGWTPMHTAAYYNSVDVALLLVDHRASVHSLTDSYEKPSDLTDSQLILAILSEDSAVHDV